MSNKCSFCISLVFPHWDVNGAEPKNWSIPRHSQTIRCGYKGYRGWSEDTIESGIRGHWIRNDNECRWFCSVICLSEFYKKEGYILTKAKIIKSEEI